MIVIQKGKNILALRFIFKNSKLYRENNGKKLFAGV